MVKRILDYFVSPIPSNYEKDLVSRWLGIIFVAIVRILFLYGLVVFILQLKASNYIFIVIALLAFAGLMLLLRKGQVRLASTVFCLFGLVAQLLASYYFGGVRSPSYNALVVVIALSALFLRGKITVFITGASILAGFLLLMVELGGVYQADMVFLTPFQSWISSVLVFSLAAVVLGALSRQVRIAFQRVAQEIEGRRQIEAALREKTNYLTALHETTLSIINRLELIPLLDSILLHAEKLAQTEHGYIDMRLPGREDAIQLVGHGVFNLLDGVVVIPGHGAGGEVLITGKAKVVNDYQNWNNRVPEFALVGFQAVMAVPMKLEGEVIGIIGLAYTDPAQKFTDSQVKLLEQFAELTALALDNARLYQEAQSELAERKLTEEALKNSEENLHLALEAARMGTWDWNITENTLTWSDSVYSVFGLDSEQFEPTPANYKNAIHPADREMVQKKIEKSLADASQIYEVEHRIFWKNGSIHWLECRGKVYFNENSQPIRMAGTVTDITERKKAQDALIKINKKLQQDRITLERRSTLLQVATEVSRAASAILDPSKLSQRVVNLVRNRFGLYYVGLFLVDQNHQFAVLNAASGESGRAMLKSGHKLPVENTSMVGSCIVNRQPRIALDVGAEAVRFNNPLLPNTRSELAMPLVTREQTIGALTIQSDEESAFSREDITTFQALADQLANAIMNARLYEQLQRELEERKRAEEEVRRLNVELEERVQTRTADLRRSEETFRALTENNPLRIRRYDRDGRYLYSNRAGINDSTSPDNVIGKTIREVIKDPGVVDMAERCIREVFDTGKPLNTEYQLGDAYASWWLAPEFGPDGNVVSVVTSTLDITERRRMEEKLHQRSAELQTANKELEAFSYSVSHDLRAPLRTIDGFSRILVEDFGNSLPPEARSFLIRISEASLQMGHLIEDLLRLSRITRTELHENPVDLSLLVHSILEELKARNPERDISLRIEENLSAKGDERLLRVALENLLNNAWKFTSKIEQAQIQVGKQVQKGELVFYIKDNGVGFDMLYVDKLFGAFQRLHSGDEFPGTGIGLAIVQRVIHKHGGRIWAEAEKGKGATFYFTL